ncbi:phosphotransferase [Bacillus sp. HMF5848]|uniref:phosphotransferase family protein n=1 Tax=Bacillus sp. HMF5848 TaxID=2495421 RepID=UPI000F776C24|nr:phosphotransferase family protein [Bacillus sp. HMF5848]RSK28221.1 phosphotransferase [Bacillus sp. HMF5848]
MEHFLGDEWEIVPAGGVTGDAYLATFEEQKLFLKRNSSPFIAVLSAEGIVPKLVWTKRLENGDVITAQHWLNGRVLRPVEMESVDVARLLRKIHHSQPLLNMFKRLGKKPLLPKMLLSDIRVTLDYNMKDCNVCHRALQYLDAHVNKMTTEEYVVCHSDINHNNWILSDNNELYLIDWDGAVIADPAMDIGMLLYWYIPEYKWETWLAAYGLTLNDSMKHRMKWYVIAQTVLSAIWNKNRAKKEEYDRCIALIKKYVPNN